MSFNYSGNPAASDRDAMRFHLGDTNPSAPLLQDEEIDYLLDLHLGEMDLLWVASLAAEDIAGRFAREVSVSGDGASIDLASLQTKFEQLASSLRQRSRDVGMGIGGNEAWGGGVDLYEAHDPSVKPFVFSVGIHDNPAAGQQSYGGSNPFESDRDTEASSP
jgi:hypothetical protein